MENKTKLTIGVFITLAMLIGSTATYYITQDDDAYYCESRDLVMICEKLSTGIGTRCYYEGTYKKCNEGWKKVELDQEIITKVPEPSEGHKWECSPEKCVTIS